MDLQRLLLGAGADGDRRTRPITSTLQNLAFTFLVDNNLIAAGSLPAAVPTLIAFAVRQRQLVAGPTLGSTEG